MHSTSVGRHRSRPSTYPRLRTVRSRKSALPEMPPSFHAQRQQISEAFQVIDRERTGEIKTDMFYAVLKVACPTVAYEELESTLVAEGVITNGNVRYNTFVSWLFSMDPPASLSSQEVGAMPSVSIFPSFKGAAVEEPEEIRKRRLESEAKIFNMGPHAPETLAAMCALADSFRAWGRLDEAEELCRQSMRAAEDKEKLLGEVQPDTMRPVSSLAMVLCEAGRYIEAEALFQRALETRQKVGGPEHPSALRATADLAGCLQASGRLKEAEELYRRTLNRQEELLGFKHPDAIATTSNLAAVLQARGRLAEAEPLSRQSASLSEESLGLGHPDALASACDLASLLQTMGRLEESERLARRALEAAEVAGLSARHPGMISVLCVLADACRSGGSQAGRKEAEVLYRRALDLQDAIFGPGGHRRIGVVNRLGHLCCDEGRLGEAESLYRQAMGLAEQAFGADHPETLGCISNLASVARSLGKLDQAEALGRRALEAKERSLGGDHPSTLVSVNNLGNLLVDLGRLVDAEPLLERAHVGLQRALGESHPYVLGARKNFAALLRLSGRAAEADSLLGQGCCSCGRPPSSGASGAQPVPPAGPQPSSPLHAPVSPLVPPAPLAVGEGSDGLPTETWTGLAREGRCSTV